MRRHHSERSAGDRTSDRLCTGQHGGPRLRVTARGLATRRLPGRANFPRYLWSAIIGSPRRKRISSQTACMACRATHHWTTTFRAATIARNDSSVSGGCPAYAERTALAPSPCAVGVHTTGTSGEYRALLAAVSAPTGRLGGRKSLSAQTTRPLPGAPYQAS